MARNRRPAIILVMAILNMVMGGFGLLCGFCAAVGNAVGLAVLGGQQNMPGAASNEMFDYMDKHCPGWQAVEVGRGLMFMLLGVLLIVAGIGMLKMQNWSRWLCLLCAAGIFFVCLGYAVYQVAFLMPATDKMHEDLERKLGVQPTPGGQAPRRVGQVIGVIASSGVPIVYALVLAIVMVLPAVGEAFSRANRRRVSHDDEEEFDDRRERWPRDREEDRDNRGFQRRPRERYYDDDED
jgi:hypothetical protein